MITIVDYGLGNVQAFANIYKRLNIPVTFARTPGDLVGSTHLILPGVGSFDWAMERLELSGMRTTLDQLVLKDGKFILGICVGMQMMARRSDEGARAGLCWFDAEVKRFDKVGIQNPMILPHMGWNEVRSLSDLGLLEKVGDEASFYFLHSYYFAPRDSADILAYTDYRGRFASAVQRQNIYGVQFHPEKSHGWGIQLLRNFAHLKC